MIRVAAIHGIGTPGPARAAFVARVSAALDRARVPAEVIGVSWDSVDAPVDMARIIGATTWMTRQINHVADDLQAVQPDLVLGYSAGQVLGTAAMRQLAREERMPIRLHRIISIGGPFTNRLLVNVLEGRGLYASLPADVEGVALWNRQDPVACAGQEPDHLDGTGWRLVQVDDGARAANEHAEDLYLNHPRFAELFTGG